MVFRRNTGEMEEHDSTKWAEQVLRPSELKQEFICMSQLTNVGHSTQYPGRCRDRWLRVNGVVRGPILFFFPGLNTKDSSIRLILPAEEAASYDQLSALSDGHGGKNPGWNRFYDFDQYEGTKSFLVFTFTTSFFLKKSERVPYLLRWIISKPFSVKTQLSAG